MNMELLHKWIPDHIRSFEFDDFSYYLIWFKISKMFETLFSDICGS